MTVLEQLRHDFATHDSFLHVLLGLVSLASRSEQELPQAPPTRPTPSAEPPMAPEDRPVLLVLGLVSVRRTLMRTLEPHRKREAPPPPESLDSPAGEPPRLRDLLR